MDIQLKLLTNDYFPYIKLNAKTTYIKKDSNYPIKVKKTLYFKKNISKMIQKKI